VVRRLGRQEDILDIVERDWITDAGQRPGGRIAKRAPWRYSAVVDGDNLDAGLSESGGGRVGLQLVEATV
jgi:hypothetical protein